jgi:hypothetical protein
MAAKARHLTYLTVYEKHRRALRLDENKRRASSLRCNADGMIESRGSDSTLFRSPVREMVSGD